MKIQCTYTYNTNYRISIIKHNTHEITYYSINIRGKEVFIHITNIYAIHSMSVFVLPLSLE